jgi:ribosomal protein S18 acetylase RimI-like enzyme
MIRPTRPEDAPALVALADATGVFKPFEIDTLREVLADYPVESRVHGDRSFVLTEGPDPIGFVYHAPEPMTEGTWSLWWIVVRTDLRGRGVGANLLKFVEADAYECGARVLFVETSSLPHYDPTRRFYLKHGYHEEARLRDFYAPGDDQIIFRKPLTGQPG